MEHRLFPDVVAVMSVEVSEVVRRLLPSRLTRWRERRDRKQEQMRLVIKLRRELRVSVQAKTSAFGIKAYKLDCILNIVTVCVNLQDRAITQRRAELMAERAPKKPSPLTLRPLKEQVIDHCLCVLFLA